MALSNGRGAGGADADAETDADAHTATGEIDMAVATAARPRIHHRPPPTRADGRAAGGLRLQLRLGMEGLALGVSSSGFGSGPAERGACRACLFLPSRRRAPSPHQKMRRRRHAATGRQKGASAAGAGVWSLVRRRRRSCA